MKKLSCLIVDDEPMALSLLESYVLKTPFLTLKAKCSSAVEAMQYIDATEQIDLFFLDIQMPELTGMEFSRLIPSTSKIVFTTAFEDYALEGYKVNAIDYLLKPFDYAEFLAAVHKAKASLALQWTEDYSSESTLDFFFVKSDYKQVKIVFSEILYIEGLKDYVKIHLNDSFKPILTLMSLKKLEEKLPSSKFMRVHRSYIIALDKIEAIERNHIVIGKASITIAPGYKEALKTYIANNSV